MLVETVEAYYDFINKIGECDGSISKKMQIWVSDTFFFLKTKNKTKTMTTQIAVQPLSQEVH